MNQIITSENIESILLAGESDTVEFKDSCHMSANYLSQYISAFANTKGGVIIFGYSKRKQIVIGTSSKDFNIIESAINKYDLANLCIIYTILYNDYELIIVQVEKSESLIIAGGAAYIRKGERNVGLSSQEVNAKINQSLENKDSLDDRLKRLEEINNKIYVDLERQRIALDEANKKLNEASKKREEERIKHKKEIEEAKNNHKKEREEDRIKHEYELAQSKKSNLFYCVLSAILGAVFGYVLNCEVLY